MTSRSRPPRGRVGRYVLYERLGTGGMADVHRARSYVAEGVVKELCIKRIRAARLSRPGATERFVAEASLSMRLAHGNIVPVFDFGRAGGEYYLAMEHVEGADLCALLQDARKTGDAFDPVVAAHVAAEVTRALAYAHELDGPVGRAIVHGDVKPANVLISRAGDVKLTDFGVATAVGEPGAGGTPAYMAPEQRRGDAVEPRTDLYALGVMLGEMLTGERAANVLEQIESIGSEELRSLVSSLVAAEPEERPASARDVAQQLEAFVSRARAEGGSAPRDALAAHARRCAITPGETESLELGPEASVARDGLTEQFARRMGATSMTLDGPPPGSPEPETRSGRVPAVAWLAGALLLSAAIGLALSVGAAREPGEAPAGPVPGEEPALPSGGGEERGVPDPGEQPAVAPGSTEGEPGPVAEAVAQDPPDRPAAQELSPAPVDDPSTPPSHPARSASREGPARPADPRPARPSPPVAEAEPALLNINVIPWAEVTVDGRSIGTTPLFNVPLPPGDHVIRVRNDEIPIERERRVSLDAGERRNLVIDLQ